MSEEGVTGELLGVIGRRRALLASMRAGPRTKRALVSATDSSRSTVNRALRRLAALHLVVHDGETYRLTLSGRLALDAYDRFAAHAESVVATGELMSHVHPEAPMTPAMLTDAELVFPTAETAPGDALTSALARATSVSALARVCDDPVEGLLARWETDGVDAELVCRREHYEAAGADSPLRRAGDAGVVRTVEDAPYGLFVVDDGERREACLAVYDGADDLRGVVRNDAPAAVSWADRLLDEYREAARGVSE